MSERSDENYLSDRYGSSQNRRKPWVLPALLFLLFGGGWLIWSADHYSKPEISTDLIAFKVSPKEVQVRYYVHLRTSSIAHECILTASDYQANTVGQITDAIPAGAHSYSRSVLIPTRTPAVTATIEHCS
jgi:hypothetical protein